MSIADELLPHPGILTNVQILVVDNDRDSGYLYTVLLESYGAKVTSVNSIEAALHLLDRLQPDLLICEIRFLGEKVYSLMQRVKLLALSSGRAIPTLVTSTCSASNLAQHLQVRVEAYLLKPIDLDRLVSEIQNLVLLAKIAHPLSIQDWIAKQDLGRPLSCTALAE